MHIVRRLSIRSMLLGSFLLVVLAMVLVTRWGQSAISDVRESVRSLRENELVQARTITAANAALRGWSLPTVNHILEDRPEQMAHYEEEMDAQRAAALEQLRALSLLPRFPQRGQAVLDRIRHTLSDAIGTHNEVLRLSRTGHKPEAARLFLDDLKPALGRLEGQMGELRDVRQSELDAGVAATEQRLSANARRTGWLAAGTIASAGLLVLLIVQRISRGVAEVAGAAAAVTREVLQQEIPNVPATDEITCLRKTLAALRLTLETNLAERTAVQQHLRELEADLAHAARVSMMGEMTSGLAHELTQPLSAIAGYTQACLERIRAGTWPMEALQTPLRKAAAETKRAGAIIKRVRAFVRREPEPRAVLEVNDLVREALRFMDYETRRARIPVRLDLAPTSPSVSGSRIELEQVLVNLLRNAVEAMRETPESELTIRTGERADGTVEVAIADRGSGLPPAVRENLFRPFFTTKAHGMGMGLVISRTIIEDHGGQLRADENPGGGTVFRLALPGCRGSNEYNE